MARPRLVALCALLVAGCGGAGGARTAPPDPNVVEGADIDGRALARVEEMLRGQIAGVHVYQEGGNLVVRIRGPQSFQNGGDPLFVIDGLPLTAPPGEALIGINPRDVESIRVLKGAAETAAYGSRGANGVVLITTVGPPPPPRDGDGRP